MLMNFDIFLVLKILMSVKFKLESGVTSKYSANYSSQKRKSETLVVMYYPQHTISVIKK